MGERSDEIECADCEGVDVRVEDRVLDEIDERSRTELADEHVCEPEHPEKNRNAPDRVHRDRTEPGTNTVRRNDRARVDVRDDPIDDQQPVPVDCVGERIRHVRLDLVANLLDLDDLRFAEVLPEKSGNRRIAREHRDRHAARRDPHLGKQLRDSVDATLDGQPERGGEAAELRAHRRLLQRVEIPASKRRRSDDVDPERLRKRVDVDFDPSVARLVAHVQAERERQPVLGDL